MDTPGLHWFDVVVVAAYAAWMLGVGWYYSRRQTSTSEYFIGNGAMNPFLIGVSLFATLMSTISYLSFPGEVLRYGPVVLCGMLSIPFSFLLVGYWLIPAFMHYRVTSAYELLEIKLGLGARLAGASFFVLIRLAWMATLLNFAGRAMVEIAQLDDGWLFPVTAFIGAIALIYSSMGGLRAVVITDFIQALLLFGGALLVIGVVTYRMGGFGWFPTGWQGHWDTQPLYSFDPYQRVTVLTVVLMQFLWSVATAGGDQTAIQRYMATRDAAAARRSYLVNACWTVMVICTLSLVGLAILGYCREFPGFLRGDDMSRVADRLFPRFITTELPVGITGLVVSGMFAAAMSSVDSGVNSITAVVMTDFLDRFRHQKITETQHVRYSQLLAVSIGVTVIGLSAVVDLIPGNLFEISKRFQELPVTPLFTLFLLALFVPFATVRGTIAGAVAGLAAAVTVAYWNVLVEPPDPVNSTATAYATLMLQPNPITTAAYSAYVMTPPSPISFTFIHPAALFTSVSVGYLASLADRRLFGAGRPAAAAAEPASSRS